MAGRSGSAGAAAACDGETDHGDEPREHQLHQQQFAVLREQDHRNRREYRHRRGPGELSTGRLEVMLSDPACAHQACGHPEGEPVRDGEADGDPQMIPATWTPTPGSGSAIKAASRQIAT